MKRLSSFLVCGGAMLRIASTFFVSGRIPVLVIQKPRYSISDYPKNDFKALIFNPTCRLIRLFSSLKSEINRTVPSFFGMMNVGAAHSLRFIFFSTLIEHNLLSSTCSVYSCTLGIGKGLAWYGVTLSLS